jgi:tRNA(Ile)-lysidine synthetase-like protein
MNKTILSDIEINQILNFWFNNNNNEFQKFWFDSSVDEYIKLTYSDLLSNLEQKIEHIVTYCCNKELFTTEAGRNEALVIIIIFDQFTRNIFRNTNKNIFTKNDKYAFTISKFIIENSFDLMYNMSQRLFLLLPYRHQKHYTEMQIYAKYLDIVLERITLYKDNKTLSPNEIDLLDRFTIATLKNYTELHDYDVEINTNINSHDHTYNLLEKYSNNILDVRCYNFSQNPIFSERFNNTIQNLIKSEELFIVMKQFIETNYNNNNNNNNIIGVSLSGGIDSMVTTFILKHMEQLGLINKVVAVHIYYGNRPDSMNETNFIKDWCKFYDIPVIVKYIRYMKRDLGLVDRNFYEEETRKIRFNTYKLANKIFDNKIIGFCLGHHKDDIAENIFMNIMKGRDILDICVMKPISVLDTVMILRPFLSNHKSDIYNFSDKYSIPYTKDTTPSWSCRGVMRQTIFPLLEKQFGNFNVHLNKLGERSNDLHKEKEQQINYFFDSIVFEKYGCKINKLDELLSKNTNSDIFWTRFLVKIFHTMNASMTKSKTIKPFINWFNNTKNNMFKFSNNYIAVIHLDNLYLIKLFKYTDWKITIAPQLEKEIRDKITYDDAIKGLITYTEKYIDRSPIKIFDKYESLDKKDSTKKLFSDIYHIHNFIPKCTSGLFKVLDTEIEQNAQITIQLKQCNEEI